MSRAMKPRYRRAAASECLHKDGIVNDDTRCQEIRAGAARISMMDLCLPGRVIRGVLLGFYIINRERSHSHRPT